MDRRHQIEEKKRNLMLFGDTEIFCAKQFVFSKTVAHYLGINARQKVKHGHFQKYHRKQQRTFLKRKMLNIEHFCALARVAITIKFLTPRF